MEDKEIINKKLLDTKSNQNKPTLQTILTIVGLGLTIIAYIMGKAYYDAYMQGFGLNSDFFPITIQDIYFYSYIAFIQGLSNVSALLHKYIVSILISTAIVIIILYGMKQLSNKKPQLLLVKFPIVEKIFLISKIKFIISMMTTTFLSLYLITLFIYGITIFLMFGVYLYLGPHSSGYDAAIRKIKEYNEHGCYIPKDSNANTCIHILDKDNQEIAKGVFIAYANDKIAFLNNEGSQIITFPADGKIITDINMTKQ